MAQDCAPFGVYSFSAVAFNIDGRLVTGFAEDDDCIMIEPTTELGTAKVGADGSSILSITADQSANVTIKLLPNSPFNAYLQQKVDRMRAGALTGISFPIGFTDLSSRESGGCTQATVSKIPNVTRGPQADTREWRFFCPCWQASGVDVAVG